MPGTKGSMPGQGTKILHATQHSQKKRKIQAHTQLKFSDKFSIILEAKCYILQSCHTHSYKQVLWIFLLNKHSRKITREGMFELPVKAAERRRRPLALSTD